MRYFGNNIKTLVNNLEVSYTDQGPDDAPVLIFIHGFPLNKSMWNKQVEVLKEDYRVIAYDIRGHGESDTGTEDFSIRLFENDLIMLMDKLKIDKASLCGLSMGGYIALNAIVYNPERFDSLVLSDTSCLADTPEAKTKRVNAINSILEKGVNNYADESVKNLFAPESFSTKETEIVSVKEMICNTKEVSICCSLLALSARKETCNKLSGIDVPVLVLVGEEDKITPPEVSKMMYENIKDSTLHVIQHAAHLSNLENPGEFNNQLQRFFETVYKKPTTTGTDNGNSIISQLSHKLNILLSF
ncbi:alpha/beta fold hydrolase [Flavobacterium sp. UBA6031]|uniref:alpha/beta fold hydrolase n=1 Tax=Flavobacterium sp. UBA6031 TaxID=1946551 RepID=UPI0025C14CE1|nr:alpha/beta fold hydrolase [Flavobacterium sp. UBA6031]